MNSLDRVERIVRSPVGRIAVAGLGLAVVALVLGQAGPAHVWASVQRVAPVVPIVFALEGLYNVIELLALRRLYGEDRRKLPASELFRAGLIAYALGGVMPLGRPIVESVRGFALARWTTGARAAAAGTRLQYLLLISQAGLCIPCALAAHVLDAPRLLLLALLANGALTGAMGAALALAARRGAIGARLSKLSRHPSDFGPELDRHLQTETLPAAAVALVIAGRSIQVLQHTVLLSMFVGGIEWTRGLGLVAVQMVGATLGDFIPTHLGGTEAMATVGATTLSLPLSDALAIPLVIHAEQAAWIGLGFVAYGLWPIKTR